MQRMKAAMYSDFMTAKILFDGINCNYSPAGDYFYIDEKEIAAHIMLKERHLRFCSEYLNYTYILRQGRKYPFSNVLIEKKYKNMLDFKIYYEREWEDKFYKPENFYDAVRGIDINDKRFFRESCGSVFVTIPTTQLEGRMILKDTFVSGLYIPRDGEKLYFRNAEIEKEGDSAYLSISFSSLEEASFVLHRGLVDEE